MDFQTQFRYVVTLFLWILYTIEATKVTNGLYVLITLSALPVGVYVFLAGAPKLDRPTESPPWLRNLLHSKQSSRTKRFTLNMPAEHQRPEKYLKDCCKNNGLCILGSFCQCKSEFYGRYCQWEVRLSQCGVVKHGQWFQSNCSLCRCHNGQSICLEGAYGQCDSKVFSKDYNAADSSNIVQIFPLESGEGELENSWLETDDDTSGSSKYAPCSLLVSMIVLLLSSGVV